MKKLLAISALTALLAACSNHNHHPHGKPDHNNPQFEEAMKSCHKTIGETKDRTKFDECMKTKGFEKPANHPAPEIDKTRKVVK